MKRLPFYLGQVILVLIILWWRSHTFGPAIVDEIGFNLWPYAQTETEPLDCDESAYAYMGRRQAEGAVLYQDLTEYKPPLGYWYYALGMAIGGNHELTVRLMILPVLVVNLMLVGWILRQTANSWASILGQICFVVLSTDPYVYGNGSNFEHLMNLFLTAAIAALIKAGTSEHQPAGRTYLWLMLSGVSLGLAVCVKQVCIMAAIPLAVFILTQNSSFRKIVTGFLALGSGFLLPLTVSVVILALQGALTSAWQDVIVYSRTMASLTPPDVKAPSLAIRWITGNSDPRNGHLPWPFGKTDWLVWWGTGSWPILLAVTFIAILSIQNRLRRKSQEMELTLVLFWFSCWLMIVLPGLYWQHYYLLLAPGSSLILAQFLSDNILSGRNLKQEIKRPLALFSGIAVCFCLFLTIQIQIQSYFMVTPSQLTAKYKGGAQWITLREMSGEIQRRISNWSPQPKIEVWGWQSPLLFYTGLDAPSRYFFTDPLMKLPVGQNHPAAAPRLVELTEKIIENKPELIFCGDVPYPSLKQIIDRDYIASPLVPSTPGGQGLFVSKNRYVDFHSAR